MMSIAFWINNIRLIIYISSTIIWLGIYFFLPAYGLAYGLLALTYLYFSMLSSPLKNLYPASHFMVVYGKSRKAFGLSAFAFAFTHAFLELTTKIGGFAGLALLDARYRAGIIASATALFILTLMAITSLQYLHKKMGKYWKWLHSFVYLAGVLIVIHVALIGPDFTETSSLLPKIFFLAVAMLFILEAIRFYNYYFPPRKQTTP